MKSGIGHGLWFPVIDKQEHQKIFQRHQRETFGCQFRYRRLVELLVGSDRQHARCYSTHPTDFRHNRQCRYPIRCGRHTLARYELAPGAYAY